MRNLILQFTGAAAAALLAFCPAVVRAQGVTSAAIEGTVTDASGQPVAGATVTGVHTPSGTTYSATTRSGGNYTLSNVRVGGPYSVTVSSPGTGTKRITGINTDLSQATRVNVKLAAAVAAAPATDAAPAAAGDPGRVVVEASVVDDETFSPNRTGAATNINRGQIEALPTISRSLQDFTRLTPQVNGGSVGGANNRFNNISIDGATINDAFGLEASGLLTARSEPISLDVVDQVRVSLSPYDVRQSNFTGGSIDAVTKSGTNRFRGSVYGYYRDEDFVGKSTYVVPTPANDRGKTRTRLTGFEEYTYGFTLGGPIIKDKLFFFVGFESKRRTEPQLGSIGLQNDGSGFFSTALSLTNTAATIATTNTQYGYNPGTTGTSLDKVQDDKYFARIDWNITKDQKLTIRYNHVESEFTDGASRSNSSYTLTGRQYLRPYSSDSVVLQLFSTWTPTFTTEARVAYNRLRTERQVSTPFASVAVLVDSGKTLNFGVERSSQQNQLDQDVIESVLNASYFWGNHTFTAGINVDNFSYRNLFVQDAFGTYTFTTPGRYALGQPARYQNSYLLPGGEDTVNWSYYNLGFYLQDEWKVTKNLTVTAGIRADLPIFPEDPRRNAQFAADFNGRDTSKLPSGQVAFSPRFGFNWNVFGTDFNSTESGAPTDAKGGPYTSSRKRWWELGTVVRGGAGLFNGKTPSVWISNQYSNTGLDFVRVDTNAIRQTTVNRTTGATTFSTVTLGSTNFNSASGITVPINTALPATGSNARVVPIALFNANPNAQFTIPQVNALLAQANYSTPTSDVSFGIPANQTAIAITSPNFRFPQLFRANLAIDQKLPWGFVLTLEGLLSRNVEAVTYRNLNLPATNGSLQDGRNRYPGGAANAAYTNVIEIANTSKGSSYIGTVSLERPMQKDGWAFKVAYTRSNVKTAGDYTSSVAASNWVNNVISNDPNNPGTTRSFFEIRDRLIASVSYGINVGKPWQTVFSLFYDGHSGQPYSVVFGSDINNDGVSGNDSFFVPNPGQVNVVAPTINPATPNSPAQLAANAAASAAFFNYIDGNKFLRDNKGKILPVNGGTNPWVNRLDLRITQGIPIPSRFGKLEFYYDVLNVLNLLSPKWGGIKTYGGSLFNNVFFGGVTATTNAAGQYTYTVTNANSFPGYSTPTGTSGSFSSPSAGQANLDARWQMQFGLRYTF